MRGVLEPVAHWPGQQYNTLYPAQVRAMEERATKIGKPKFFYYMSPNNANWLNVSQSAEVEALGLGDHVVSDMHVGAGGGVEKATQLFSKFPKMTMGAVNAETNDGSHTMTRAAKEAEDLNKWFNGTHHYHIPSIVCHLLGFCWVYSVWL